MRGVGSARVDNLKTETRIRVRSAMGLLILVTGAKVCEDATACLRCSVFFLFLSCFLLFLGLEEKLVRREPSVRVSQERRD